MSRSPGVKLLSTLCLMSALGTILPAQAQEAAGPIQSVTVNWQRNPSKWFRAESQHVVVYSDTDSDDVTRLLNNLERLDYLLRAYTKGYAKTGTAQPKLTLYYAKRIEDLGRLGLEQPADAVGLYSSCAAGVNGFGAQLAVIDDLKDTDLAKGELNASLSHLFEAYARHFLYRNTDLRAPTWFIDGFAQYFSSVRFTDTQLIVGRTPTVMGRYLDFVENGRRRSLDYKDVLEQNDSSGINYANTAGVKLEFQARSWVLVHFILSSEDNRRRLGAYLKAFYDGVPSVQAFEQAFGLQAASLSTDMWRYRLQAAKVVRAEQQALPRANIGFASMPQAAGDFVLADALLRSCPGAGQRQALLDTLRTEAGRLPNSTFAQLTLSRALIDTGHADEALPRIEQALRSDDTNAELHTLAGLAHLRAAQAAQAGTGRTGHLAAAGRSLARAASLDPVASATPALAPASGAVIALAALQADLLAGGDPGQPALDGIIAAWHRTRDVNALGKAAVLAYAWQGDGISSANLLRSMASNRRDPDTAAWAQTWQKRLDAGLTRDAIRAGLRSDPWPTPAFREWTIANESVMDAVVEGAGFEDARQFYDRSADPAKGEPQLNTPLR
jgi:hypothetical protein